MPERPKFTPRDFTVSETKEKGMYVVEQTVVEQNFPIQKIHTNNSSIDTGYGKQNRRPNKRGGGQFGRKY